MKRKDAKLVNIHKDRSFLAGVQRFKKLRSLFVFRFLRFFKKKFLSVDTLISYGGFIVSITVLTAALSLLYGYQKTLKEGILGVNGHIYIYSSYQRTLDDNDISLLSSFLEEIEQVVSFSPVVLTQGMASKIHSGEDEVGDRSVHRIKGVVTRSIEWEKKELPTNYEELIVEGTAKLFNTNDAVVGEKLAEYLGVKAGDRIRITTPANMRYTLFGLKTGSLEVNIVGIYRSGVYETDSRTVFLNENAVRSLLGESRSVYNSIELAVHEEYIDRANEVANDLRRLLHYQYHIDSWIDYNGNLFTMLVVQRWVIFIILSFIILIASFGIASNTAKTLVERKREIGILSAIGADSIMIKSYLMGETTMLGIISIILGISGGILMSWLLTKQTLLMLKGDVYFIERFSTQINPVNLLLITIVSLTIALLASYAALNRISRLTVIETVAGK